MPTVTIDNIVKHTPCLDSAESDLASLGLLAEITWLGRTRLGSARTDLAGLGSPV